MNGLIFKFGDKKMITTRYEEKFIEQNVTYTLFKKGKVYVVENVPARVNPKTGEQFFAPETVERLQEIILGEKDPQRMIQAPVFKYS
jgi:hypothetical protein